MRKFIYFFSSVLIICTGFSVSNSTFATEKWLATTLDNDLFVGNDNGYTNGFNISLFEVDIEGDALRPNFLLMPLAWSLSEDNVMLNVNSFSLGQAMSTPSDTSLVNPPDDDLPYAGMLYFTNQFARAYRDKNYADRISTIIGIVGPSSYAEQTQKQVHKLIGSDEPMGWDTQLGDELAFEFSRARVWRAWHSVGNRADILYLGDVNLGTIESSVNTGGFFRLGRHLQDSYESVLFLDSRISNPISPRGWQVYMGVRAGYVFNQIFLDGNTFKDSRSVDYDPERVGGLAGFSFALDNYLFSFAVYDLNLLASDDDNQSDLTQFGTFTFAFRL